jgi:eukaryotic-like serine/threonine-protein kinase
MGTAPKTPKAVEPAIKVGIGDMVLDRYRVVEQIASGGHSVVFRGTDERLSRPVCIKVFSGLGGKSGVGRTSYEHFVQEAFALSRLTHPNTLRIYDFGHLGTKDAEGMPLQVCEFMNGGTLSQVVREQGKQSLAETSRVIGAMCAALGEAHALGIVHRDIKPQNILFGSVGTTKLPKLADFGIAKWSADENEQASKRAEDTAIVAGQKLAMYSPSWAAPEQLAGQPVSAATDIYSLAVVAVYMLTSRAIFADEDVYAGYKKRRHADELVKEALAPCKVPKSIAVLLGKALAFDPKKRLAKVEELASELAAAVDEPLEAPAPAAEPTEQLHLHTPTIPNAAVTPPAGMPIARPPEQQPTPPSGPYPRAHAHSTPPASRTPTPPPFPGGGDSPYPRAHAQPSPYQRSDAPSNPPYARTDPSVPYPRSEPAAGPTYPRGETPSTPPYSSTPSFVPTTSAAWQPPDERTPWMAVAPSPSGTPQALQLSDVAQQVGGRRVHFIHATTSVADLVGGQGKVRVTFLTGAAGSRVIHLKGMSCFVAHLGGRPSPAVQIDQPGDIALVTPRAQEIGHVRVANGVPGSGHLVFPIGAELVAIGVDDCTDPILFDFGPGSDAYFVYTRGRAIPKSRRR